MRIIKRSPTAIGLALRGTEPPPPRACGDQYYDSKAGRCYQCGCAIEDIEAEKVCPFCQSDNFKGEVVTQE
jgi:hypothetical protein